MEFLRPGLILPGVIGAALIIFSIAAFLKSPINWAGVVVLFGALGCFLLAARGIFERTMLVCGSLLVAASTAVLAALPVAILAGFPFAILTGYLISIAIKARRNKTQWP